MKVAGSRESVDDEVWTSSGNLLHDDGTALEMIKRRP
jgi:hypothetical protein